MRKRIAFWLAPLCLMLALFLSFPSAAQLYQVPGPNSPTKKEDVPIYRQEPDKIVGRVSIPDEKLATLIQPEGREWRSFRLFIFRTVATVASTSFVLFSTVLARIPVGSERFTSAIFSSTAAATVRLLAPISMIAVATTTSSPSSLAEPVRSSRPIPTPPASGPRATMSPIRIGTPPRVDTTMRSICSGLSIRPVARTR